MKKILVSTFLLAFCINFAYALSWSQLKSWTNKDIEPDVKYNIETEGYNVRVYEFTPLTDPGSTCIMTFTNEKMGMFCFNKSKDAIKKK
ncbi:hypothetical protein [Arcobacter roscoffensis]|uniref:Uncharacterized protein n=1 Tax=Arcobacter roscoffensis TaxID=2961520 RepID=A0ABY5E117_9BACT|nr:hypothetical protein [Arcobacter roscoffensis]UTJ05897.1 hypothetical protein NJU99_11645 [Arcobacter roscoffensis]